MEKLSSIGQFEWLRNRILSKTTKDKSVVHVCMTGCRAHGSASVKDALEKEVEKQGLSETVEIRSTGCHGFCAKAPVVGLEPLGIQYQEVAPEDAAEITSQTLKKNRLIERLAYKDPKTKAPIFHLDQIPFYAKQEKRVLKRCGRIDPKRVADYIAEGGYLGIVKALTKMSPDEVIEEVLSAGLKGRGGAGFPTGLKWKFARQAAGQPKYIICNADEGDPGAFMDRAILEGDPHAVLEGMLIGAYAIGAVH
jgi:NADH-quinone oxidoreductase subunit F